MTHENRHQDCGGGEFAKADLHIHTPESKCYGDPAIMPAQIVSSALSAGLQLIAITDHNTTLGIEPVRRLGREKGLVVLPGIEVSTTSGHVLALFDVETPATELDGFLDDIGTVAAARGDGTVAARDPIETVFGKAVERGGIVIAAHIERWPTGFLQTKDSRRAKQRIHASEHLAALEITQPLNREAWNEGRMRGFPKGRACIQGSDAHAVEEIGRRPVYLRMRSLDLDGLRQALTDFAASIRFPDDAPNPGETVPPTP
jgi:predicted metal-dependent phosphoesterase TrpH